MMESPLSSHVVFMLGPAPVTKPVVVTWGLMAALTLGCWLAARAVKLSPTRAQAAVELVVDTIQAQIRSTIRADPRPYLPLLGTLFLFILAANWTTLVPGVEPPTATLETDVALAMIVFVAVVWFGVQAQGVRGYLRTFAQPTLVMVPLNLISTFSRTLALIVRLFGNVVSGVFIVGVLLSLAGLLVPIPLMALELLTGAIQAYIFTVLAMVFIGAAVSGSEGGAPTPRSEKETA